MEESALIRDDINEFLRRHEHKELLRFVTVGSVDDGKSTLIGRLLYDSDNLYEDHLTAIRRASNQVGQDIDLSLVTDGLRAEREQGITIDVAYRYFATAKRKFIIADTPGHVQYTRNMATGASTADVGIILIDARQGVLQQSRRHAYIASLLGIPHLVVAINKMDLKDYSQEIFENIKADFARFAEQLSFKQVAFFPISALAGDNIVHASAKTPWFDGGTILSYLESVPITDSHNLTNFRYPVQYVLRPNLDYRGFSGQIASGQVRKGDEVMVLPSRKRSRVSAIDTFHGEVETAQAPQSVTLRLADEIDISRGDMIVHPQDLPRVDRRVEAMVVWLSERPLDPDKSYLLKHTTQLTRATVQRVQWRIDLDSLERVSAARLELNDIGRLTLQCHRSLYFDPYQDNRAAGAFILVDSLTNNTVGAGMLLASDATAPDKDDAAQGTQGSQVSHRERRERLGQSGAVIWLTGRPGCGKTALAYAIERRLFDLGHVAMVIDPADGGPPGPDGEAHAEALEAARRAADAGLIVICAFASPSEAGRDAARERIGSERFVEVHVQATGVEASGATTEKLLYVVPKAPAVTVQLDGAPDDAAAEPVVAALEARGSFEQS